MIHVTNECQLLNRRYPEYNRLKSANGFVPIYTLPIVLGFCTIKLLWIVNFLTVLRKTSLPIAKKWDLLNLEHRFLSAYLPLAPRITTFAM